jgi:xylan 1,4-beta-xylosidase
MRPSIRRVHRRHELPEEFQWLRTPYPERIFSMTGSALRLHARESIGSWFEQSLVARRQEHLGFRAETTVSFRTAQFPADRRAGALLQPAQVPLSGRHLARGARAGADHSELPRRLAAWQARVSARKPVALPGDGPVELAMDVDGADLQFFGGCLARTGRLSARCSMPA